MKKVRPVKKIGAGKDGHVFASVRRDRNSRSNDGTMPTSFKLVAIKVRSTVDIPEDLEDLTLNTEDAELGPETAEFFAYETLKQSDDPESDNPESGGPRPSSLPRVHEFLLDPSRRPYKSWCILEFVEGCAIAKLLNGQIIIPAWLIGHVFVEVVAAVEWLHENGLCHRDLDTENIMMAAGASEPRVVVIDFSSATESPIGEHDDCYSLYPMVRELVEDGATKVLHREVDTGIKGIWDTCGALAIRIKEEGKRPLSAAIRSKIEEGVLSDDEVTRLYRERAWERICTVI